MSIAWHEYHDTTWMNSLPMDFLRDVIREVGHSLISKTQS